jgi:hypothetical protein
MAVHSAHSQTHMCLLVIEARYMAALLYCLNAISNFADR